MEMNRLIGQGIDVFRVKRTYRDYQIVDEGGDVLAHITYDSLAIAGGEKIHEVKVWSYYLDDIDNIKVPKITAANVDMIRGMLSQYFAPKLTDKIISVSKRIFKRWG
jgi:hypothetical protein